jgi:hypothetical protein
MNSYKLGIIIPYRHRYQQLLELKSTIIEILNQAKIDYEIIIVEQDDAKTFNRGKLLNVGYTYAKKLNCNYIVFHDVDMIPVDVDYSYSEYPVHLASNFISESNFSRTIFDTYFGGVTIFPINVFESINGYSNEYWGWGYEDDDLLFRCKVNNISLDYKKIPMMGGNTAALKLNGNDAFIEFNNVVDLEKKITFFITFYPDDISCNHKKYDDVFSVFTIPGFDLTISYNSYSRYNFELYDSRKNILYINSDIKVNYKTNICVTLDPILKEVKMYQDGVLIGVQKYIGYLYDYKNVEKIYLGVGDPNREEEPKFFKGLINSFAIFSTVLTEKEIIEISKNKYFGLTQNFGDFESSHALLLYYDAKCIKDYMLIDLSGSNNNGKITNCEIVGYNYDEHKTIQIPYRRDCTFKLLSHPENGYVDGSWKDMTTRYNQMRFFNEVSKGYKNPKEDGLSDLKYKELTHAYINKQTHVLVSI